MRTLSEAAARLAAIQSVDDLAALASSLGFATPAVPLDAATREALGIAPFTIDARIASSTGALRALLVALDGRAPVREAVTAIAARLAAGAPHLLWLLLAARAESGELALAAWQGGRARPRIAALVVQRACVAASDAETLCALASVSEAADVLTHAYWHEVLGREALTRRFYRALEQLVRRLAAEGRGHDERVRHEIALLYVSRLLFLSFLETKGWLAGDHRFLAHHFARSMEAGGDFQRRVLLPLFFGTLNTPIAARARAARDFGAVPFLNGGLFSPTPLERRARDVRFPDAALGALFDELLARYRFTAREESEGWSEAAIDPEMLGKAFESLMASTERRGSGAYYTPHALVSRTTRAALAAALAGRGLDAATIERAIDGGGLDDPAGALLRARLRELRILDPACGSGAFLVHALETVAALRQRTGDVRATAAIRRDVLTRSIFGVDVNPTAVWLCELRLWLSVVIESQEHDPERVTPLPNLDRHVRAGDSLAGDAFGAAPPPGGGALASLRERYARSTGARKRTLERLLARSERALALAHVERAAEACRLRRRDLIAAARERDLFGARVRPTRAHALAIAAERGRARELAAIRRALVHGAALPFAWTTHFPDAARAGGFDVVLGNPPWVRLHRIPATTRAALRARYTVFADAAWSRGAAAARAGLGFAAQVDLAALFLERALALLRAPGALGLLLPAKLWRSLAGGGARRLVRERAHVLMLEDWCDSPSAFDATVYPTLLVARRADRGDGAPPTIAATVHRRSGALHWCMESSALALEQDAASPWLTVPPVVREAFDRMRRAGQPLADSLFGPPMLGVKCGCNEAFLVRWSGARNGVAEVESGDRRGRVERALLRPALRGEQVTPWTPIARDEWLLYPHDDAGAPLPALPPLTAAWLSPWRRRLTARADARPGARWWMLFRTPAASAARARVVWADVARAPRALVLPPGDETVPLNTCYVLACDDGDDALAFAALLNSPLAAAWLAVLAEPARGGYHRYFAWTVALLPIPRDWARARRLLAPLGARGVQGEPPAAHELLAATLRAYRLRHEHVAPLLAWTARS